MAAVMIGVDPHKGSHTAVAIGSAEEPLGELRVRASAAQAGQLVAWATDWPERTWAVEGAGGLGHLLAQQLVAAGERVLDVQPKLGARVRLLTAGDTNKNDPNDARSVAVAALRSATRREVRSLKRRVSDAIFGRLQADARQPAATSPEGPGGQPGNDSVASAAGLHPGHRLFGQATPGPGSTLRPATAAKRTVASKRSSTNTRRTS
jgi:transposase